MKKLLRFIPLAVIGLILAVLDYHATKNMNAPVVAEYKAEFMADWFRGSVLDWVGLIGFNLLWLAFGFAIALKVDIYEEKGSLGKSILSLFVMSIVLIALIYLG